MMHSLSVRMLYLITHDGKYILLKYVPLPDFTMEPKIRKLEAHIERGLKGLLCIVSIEPFRGILICTEISGWGGGDPHHTAGSLLDQTVSNSEALPGVT